MPRPHRGRGGAPKNRGGRGGASTGYHRSGMGFFMSGDDYIAAQILGEEVPSGMSHSPFRGGRGGRPFRGRGGSSNHDSVISNGRGRGSAFRPSNRGRGRGRGGYDYKSNVDGRGNLNSNASSFSSNSGFKGKENLKVKNAQSVPFDYTTVMATTAAFKGKGSRNRENRVARGYLSQSEAKQEAEMRIEDEDLQTMLAKQLESEDPISATEIADSLVVHAPLTRASSINSKGKQRAISEASDDSDEDIVLEPPTGYVHKIKPHLERGYALSTEEDTEMSQTDEEDEQKEEEDYGGMMEEEERYIYEDDVPDLPATSTPNHSNSNSNSVPLYSFRAFTSTLSNTPAQITAENQKKVPLEFLESPNEGSSATPSTSVFSSAGIASIIPTGPSTSAGNRWWGAVGLPSARKSGMGSATHASTGVRTDPVNYSGGTASNLASQGTQESDSGLRLSQHHSEEAHKANEKREAADRAREAERVQAQMIQNASHQPQGAHTGLGSSNVKFTSGVGAKANHQDSNQNPALSESLTSMNSYSKGTDLDYQAPKQGFEPYVPAKKILPPMPPGAAKKTFGGFRNTLPAPGAFVNDRQALRIPVAFVKATGDWKNGKFVRFEEENFREVKAIKRGEAVEVLADEKRAEQATIPAMQAVNEQYNFEREDSDDLIEKLQQSYPGLEITMEEDTKAEVEIQKSPEDVNGGQGAMIVDDHRAGASEDHVDGLNVGEEAGYPDRDEEILIPSRRTSLQAHDEVVTESDVIPASEIVAELGQQAEQEVDQDDPEVDQEEMDQDALNEEIQTKLALEQSRARLDGLTPGDDSLESTVQQISPNGTLEPDQNLQSSFVLDITGESPLEVEARLQNPVIHTQTQSWRLGPSKSSRSPTLKEHHASSPSSPKGTQVTPWEAATGSSSSHPRLPRDRGQGSKTRNAQKKSRRRSRMNKFNGTHFDSDDRMLEKENNERIPREGDSDLDWGSDGPPGQTTRLEDQSPDDSDDEAGQIQRAIRESLNLYGFVNDRSGSATHVDRPTQAKAGSGKGRKPLRVSNGVDEAVLKDYMENALDVNPESGDIQDQESLLNFLKSMDPQRGGRQMDEIDILIEKKMDEEDDWMSVSDEDETDVQEAEEIQTNGMNSTLTRKALSSGMSPGNDVKLRKMEERNSGLGRSSGLVVEEDANEEVGLDSDSDSEEDDSDDSELERALRKSEKLALGLDSSDGSDSDSGDEDEEEDDDDDELEGFGLGNGKGHNNRLKGSKKGKTGSKNAWTWAQEDEEVVNALEAFTTSHDKASIGRDGKARNRLFKAIERGDFGSIDMHDVEFDPADPAFGVTGAIRGTKGGKNRSRRFNEDDLFSEELESQWKRDRAKKANAKKARQAEREAAAQNAFKNTHGKKKGNSKAARRAEKRARKATEAGHFIQDGLDDDEDVMMADVNVSFGGSGAVTPSKKFNQKISSNPTIEGDYLRQAQTLQEVNEQIMIFLKTPGHSTLVLPAMDKRARAQVHLLANSYDLKSQSKGSGNNRFPTLIKTSRSGYNIDHRKISKVLSGRSNFKFGSSDNRYSGRAGGKKDKKTVGATGGGSMAPKNREGAQVGFGADKIGSENVGHKLLSMMGWNEGNGLGNQRMEGINEPVGATVKTSKGGLGF